MKTRQKKAAPAGDEHPDLFAAAGGQQHSPPQPSPRERGEGADGPPLPFKLEKPLVFLDLEATGLDVKEDRIVEFSAVKIHPDGRRAWYTTRLNPEVPIPMEATAIHGISDADVRASPTFRDLAKEIYTFLMGCDLGGFGVSRYDLHLLAQEFKRAGYDFTDKERRVIDAQTIFHKQEPRDLTAALKFFTGRDLVGAHGARADCEASLDVFLAQLERYQDLPREVATLHAFCNQSDERFVDPHGRLFWKHGEACFNFGKYRSKTLQEIALSDPRYLEWLVGEGKSSPDLLEIYRQALRGFYPQKKS